MNDDNLQIAELFLRLFAGTLFSFQGYDKLFRIKIPILTEAFALRVESYGLSRHLLNFFTYCSSSVELAAGLMLLTGFLTNFALYALGVNLLVVSFVFTFFEPMWNLRHVLPRLALVIFLLLVPIENKIFSLDQVLHQNESLLKKKTHENV
ncbi:hypothetical protein CNR22_02045 [Sphingobacteriaceae bacterium]|nr:hypothetical protein CNR22_02045 [Sphingobacteriaceae bacterium]